MKLFRPLAAMALAAAVTAPASAQVSGIAVADPAVVIASSQALQTAYTQIGTTYQAQRTQLETLQQQHTAILRQLDTNGDGQLSEAEQAVAQQEGNTIRSQLQANETSIAQARAPLDRARVYAIEQIARQLDPAVQQVVSQQGIQMIIAPSMVLYASDAASVTDEIVAALNTRVPSVAITPPEGWQPQQNSVALFQEIQQILVMAAAQQQSAAAAQQQGQQPAAATPVQGR